MAQAPEGIRVYVVETTHDDCRRGRACVDDDERFIYDEWIDATYRMKKFLDRRAEGCRGAASVNTSAMTREQYDKLPKDGDGGPR